MGKDCGVYVGDLGRGWGLLVCLLGVSLLCGGDCRRRSSAGGAGLLLGGGGTLDFDNLVFLDPYFAVAQAAHETQELRVLEFFARVVCDAFEESSCGCGHFVVLVWSGLFLLLLLFLRRLRHALEWLRCPHVACRFEIFPDLLFRHGYARAEGVLRHEALVDCLDKAFGAGLDFLRGVPIYNALQGINYPSSFVCVLY